MFPINLKINKISKLNDETIVSNSEINIKKGEFIYLQGKNHSGKSTILNIVNCNNINGLNIDVQITTNNEILSSQMVDSYKSKISYIRQEDEFIFDDIREELFFEFTKYGRKIDYELIQDLLNEFSLNHLNLKRKIASSTLSGGEKRKISIVKGLLNRDIELLIIDEPFNNLDLNSVVLIVNILYRLNKDKGLTIIATSHFPLFIGTTKKLLLENAKVVSEFVNHSDTTTISWKIDKNGIYLD